MSAEEDEILRELYERITLNRGDEKHAKNVVAFWGRLSEYRSRRLQSREDQSMTLIESFKKRIVARTDAGTATKQQVEKPGPHNTPQQCRMDTGG